MRRPKRYDRYYYARHMTAAEIRTRMAEVETRLSYGDSPLDMTTLNELRAALVLAEQMEQA